MNRRTKFGIIAANFLFLALFAGLWQALAPIRMRRYIQQQANEQLRGLKDTRGNTFGQFRIQTLTNDPQTGQWHLSYVVDWNAPSSGSFYHTQSSCYWMVVGSSNEGGCPVYDASATKLAKNLSLNASP